MWRLWPVLEEYRLAEEREAKAGLHFLLFGYDSDWTVDWDALNLGMDMSSPDPRIHIFWLTTHLSPTSPQPQLVIPKGEPYHGYRFLAIREVSSPSGTVQPPTRFFYCAFPATYDWRHRRTFIADQDLRIYGFDNGGKPILKWPEESTLAGAPESWSD